MAQGKKTGGCNMCNGDGYYHICRGGQRMPGLHINCPYCYPGYTDDIPCTSPNCAKRKEINEVSGR
jgi:hypothetical protein